MSKKIIGVTVGTPMNPSYLKDKLNPVTSVNGVTADENGNVEIPIPDSGGNVDLTGYATEQYVKDYAQPKGDYLTEVPEGYAKTEDIPKKPEDIGAQPSGNYLTEVPSGYATEEFVKNKIAEAELGGEEVDLSGYAQKSELPTKVSQLQNDAGYLTEHQDISGKLDASALPTAINTALAQAKASGEFDGKDGADGQPGKDGADGAPGETGDPGDAGLGFLYYNGTGLDESEDYIALHQLGTPYGYTPQIGDLVLCADGYVFKIVAITEADIGAVEVRSTGICLMGSDGVDGKDGKDGKDGQNGSDGQRGLSMYRVNSNLVGSAETYAFSAFSIPDGFIPQVNDIVLMNDGYLGYIYEVDLDKEEAGVAAVYPRISLKGEDGKDGSTGSSGADGVSPTVAVSKSGKVTTVSITDKNGTKTATINDGADGSNGKDGTSVTVKSVSESTADGGSNVVTFSDGKTVTIKNGSKGSTGAAGKTPVKGVDYFDGQPGKDGSNGADGYTPVRGVDYWTSTDKAEIESDIATELAKRGQLAPEFAESKEWLEANGDHTKMYVLDGMIYAWMLTEKEVDNGPTYTNRLPQAVKSGGGEYVGDNGEDGYRAGYRYSASSNTEKAATGYNVTGFIPAVKDNTIRIKNVTQITQSNDGSAYCVAYFFTSAYAKTSGAVDIRNNATYANGIYTFTVPNYADIAYFRVTLIGVTADTIITVNEEITDGGDTEIITEYAWASTGLAFVPADYEPRIIELEKKSVNHTSRIVALEKAVTTGGADETESAALTRIKEWDKPVYDSAPVTLIDDDRIKPALTASDRTIEAIYAKYRALRDDPEHPENLLYITETNLGLCTTSDLVPGFSGKDVLRFDFCEPSGLTEVDDPSTPKVPDPARETKPKIIFLSGIHKEWAGVYGLYYALEEIANNPEFEDIRRNAHIIVIPCANPFGLIAEYTTATNGWAAPSDWGSPSHVNANGIAPHNNFGVGYTANQNVIGSYNHSGSEAYSELETQYIDQVMRENSDAIAFVSCHNYNNGGMYGCNAIWASSATYHLCNLVYRLVDKMSKAWVRKYGDTLKQSIDSIKQNMSEADYRLGRATMSTSAGTEQQNATKYGILGVNLEISDKWVAFSDTQFSTETMTHGAEVYSNFMRTLLWNYDHKDKKEYAPNLPWSE